MKFRIAAAADPQECLVTDRVTPVLYNAEKSAGLFQEDAQIECFSLDFDADDVKVISSAEVFDQV